MCIYVHFDIHRVFTFVKLFSFPVKKYMRVICSNLRFELLMDVSINIIVFWDVTPCSLLDSNLRFRGTCCLHVHERSDIDPEHGLYFPPKLL
jgi:hypothetical protein